MIDFTNALVDYGFVYGGANGKKIGIRYNGEIYMLKFPAKGKNNELNYTNSPISEYISCHIFESVGMDAQKTILGTYKMPNGEEKIVVACKDFTSDDTVLQEFAHIKNSILSTSSSGYGVELEDVLFAISDQQIINEDELTEHFWNMFIIDSLLGNFDRHNGNWGVLYNKKTDEAKIAPIYDCGSCLFPNPNDESLKKFLENPEELEARVYTFPNSALRINDEKINPYKFINSLKNVDCNAAVLKMVPKINFAKINQIIEETPYISDIRKQFYKTIIRKRYEKILLPAYNKLKEI